MGLFDTIKVEAGLTCPNCGYEVKEIQVHELGNCLDTYRCGMILRNCPVLTGVLREHFWCSQCHNTKQGDAPQFHVVIWHGILVGVVWSEDEADRLLLSVDRLDIIGWLDQMQERAQQWEQRYTTLRADLERWHKYVAETQGEHNLGADAELTLLQTFSWPHEDIRNAEDPLAVILARNSEP